MRNGLFAPWEMWRKIAALLELGFVAFLIVVFSLPLGMGMLLALFLMAGIWKSPMGTPDYDRVQYTMMTKAYRVATFFSVIWEKRQEIFTPVVLLGAGPPREDEDHGLSPSFWPPFRLSAWWAFIFAIAMAPLEFLVNNVRAPVWGMRLPDIIMVILSVVGWYAFGQALAEERRIAPDKDGGALAEFIPATMLNKIDEHIDLRPSIIKSATFAAIPVSVIMLLWIGIQWPWWITLIACVLAFLLTGAALWSKNLAAEYRTQWSERQAIAEQWNGTWMSLLPSSSPAPVFVGQFDLPSLEEYEATLEQSFDDELDEPPPYEPLVKCAAFMYPPGLTYAKVATYVDGLRGALSATLVGVVPIGDVDAMGSEIPGTVGGAGFRVFYSEQSADLPSVLDPEANDWVTTLNLQAKVIEPISKIRGIGRCVVVTHYMVTRPESPQRIRGVKLRPLDPGVSVEAFLERLSDIQRASGVRWVRVGSSPTGDESEIMMYLGDEPVMDVTVFERPASRENQTIDQMNWLYYFYANALRGESGTPRLIRREPTTPVVDKLTFSLPPGLSMKKVRAAEESIATTSGNEFIEIALQQASEPKARPRGGPEKSVGTRFSIIAAKENPLRRVFNFTDYFDEVMPGREPGVAKINWATGVLSDDTLAYDDWGNADAPHLLVAGASGSGKSVSMSSMILQIAHNNGPGEARFWMIEPKNEMQIYRDLDVVERFVDSWTPSKEFVKNAADLLDDAVEEMERRNEAFVNHPKQPKQLSKAREIAVRESEQQGTPLERHPLYMPYLFVIIEECASLFAGVRPEEKDDQKRLISAATELARKARSAGIHLIIATQYPTKESIPSTIKVQTRSIGFRCQNEVASRVVINDIGLEDINIKGAGKLRVDGEMRLFRGFWVQDGDPDYNEQNDIITTLRKLPSNNGQASAVRQAGETPRIRIPDLSESVYALWDRNGGGARQMQNIQSGKAMYSDSDLSNAGLERATPDEDP